MKINIISRVLSIVGIFMISIGLFIYNNSVNLVGSSNEYAYVDTSLSDENVLGRESFDELALTTLELSSIVASAVLKEFLYLFIKASFSSTQFRIESCLSLYFIYAI